MITKINVLPINGTNNCVAIVQFELYGKFRVNGIKLFYDPENDKHWVKYVKNFANKQHTAYFQPCDKDTANMIDGVIWNEYLKAVSEHEKEENA